MGKVSRTGVRQQKYSPGTIYSIQLRDDQFVPVRRHQDALAVLSRVFPAQPTVADVLKCRVAFFGHCVESGIKSGRWKVIGKWPDCPEGFLLDPITYSEDILAPGEFNLFGRGNVIRATAIQIIGLDPFVMDSLPEHFEERIRQKIGFGFFECVSEGQPIFTT